jgi:hypothetical protein
MEKDSKENKKEAVRIKAEENIDSLARTRAQFMYFC